MIENKQYNLKIVLCLYHEWEMRAGNNLEGWAVWIEHLTCLLSLVPTENWGLRWMKCYFWISWKALAGREACEVTSIKHFKVRKEVTSLSWLLTPPHTTFICLTWVLTCETTRILIHFRPGYFLLLGIYCQSACLELPVKCTHCDSADSLFDVFSKGGNGLSVVYF